MISNVASLLEKTLGRRGFKNSATRYHSCPDYRSVYEGLTRDVLDRAIPSSLPLGIVSGFIQGVNGKMSTQIGCMLLTGSGQRLPHTDSYV